MTTHHGSALQGRMFLEAVFKLPNLPLLWVMEAPQPMLEALGSTMRLITEFVEDDSHYHGFDPCTITRLPLRAFEALGAPDYIRTYAAQNMDRYPMKLGSCRMRTFPVNPLGVMRHKRPSER